MLPVGVIGELLGIMIDSFDLSDGLDAEETIVEVCTDIGEAGQ